MESMFDDEVTHRNNKHLVTFSGEYEEIPPMLTMNNSIQKYDLEEILFAVTTNTKRIQTTIHYLKFWTNLSNINCLIVFDEMDFVNHTNITEYLIYEGIPCAVQTSSVLRYEERYLELFYLAWNKETTVKEYSERKKVQWFAIADDDTIWFVYNLLRTLEHYNSSNTIYLGNISTKKFQITQHGDYFAYGGGGILFSRPLALLFVQHRQECKRFLKLYNGDEMIGKCVIEELKINLTKNKNFHQMDHIGDMTGLMESGLDGLVSLHHLFKLWQPFPDTNINKSNETIHRLNIAYTTFNKNFLKRYLRLNYNTNQSMLLTLGYSVSLFNRILSHTELSLIEKTWCCDEVVDRITRPEETNKTTWYFQRLINKQSTNPIKYEMIYKKKFNINDQYSSLKVTIIN
ncbi:unnamed protein product [Adineta steineri]|uniref:Uncharacterized protein n=1 Tax=Adineta steineri TaxID=433720 RepID=A0A818RSJ5_9BILA|nr:unnamed protein product [Adineta steineri]